MAWLARTRLLALVCSALLSVTGTRAIAQTPASQPATTEQRASDQAFQRLIDEVMNVRLAGGWTVAGLLGVAPDADRGLRDSLLSARQEGRAKKLPGDVVEIEVSLPTERLAELLQGILTQFFPKADRSVVEFEARRGSSIAAIGRVPGEGAAANPPIGWRHCTERQLALTQAAAETDFRQHLMERIGQWRVTPLLTVGQLWGRYPAFRKAVLRRTQTIELPMPVFEPAGICRVSDEIGRTDVLQILTKAIEDSGETIEADMTRAVDPDFQDPLVLDGFAVAPPIALVEASGTESDGGAGRPEWVGRTLTAKVIGQPPSTVTGQDARRKMALSVARIEARRQLLLQIEQLPLPGGIKVTGLLEQLGRPAEAISAIEGTIQQAGTPSYDDQDNATVTLSARLDIVWEIVRGIWPNKDTTRKPG